MWILIFVFLSVFNVQAEEKLRFKQLFTEIPDTSVATLKTSFSKESLPYWGLIAASTGILIHYDEKIYSHLEKKGRDWGIGNYDNTRAAVSFGGQELVRLPSDTGSFLYFLGDGWMHAGIGAGFIGAGALSENNYHHNTGMMIFHGMIVSTIFNQTLKRSFGRESPEVKTRERGNWRFFPSFNEYNTKTASYDAMPSGHVMTATLTFTIMSERYPEYNKYILPLGGLWITALSFEMVNNGVHWASDYPLGIAMGYVVGKLSTQMGKTNKEKKESAETSWNIYPSLTGGTGIVLTKNF
jgi:membrane-associated phospholipid phosphatase